MKNKELDKKLVIVIGIVAFICIAVIAFVSINAGTGTSKLDEQLALGERYLSELQYEQAIVAYEAAIQIDEKCVEAYFGLADTYEAMGEPVTAAQTLVIAYEKVEEADRQEVENRFNDLAERYEEVQEAVDNGSLELGGEITDGSAESGGEGGAENQVENAGEALDPRFEACVVDGVYHHGYEKYDLTEAEEAFLTEVIQQLKAEEREAVYKMLDSDEMLELCKKYNENESETYLQLHATFDEYKVYLNCDLYDTGGGWRELAVIPLENGMGYAVHTVDYAYNGEMDRQKYWYVSECADGMFNGSFTGIIEDDNYDYLSTETGSVKNGFLDGRVLEKDSYSDTRMVADYKLGVPEIYEVEDKGDGTYIYWYAYSIDEDGNALLDLDGKYSGKTGIGSTTQTKEEVERTKYIVGGYSSTGYEREDGSMEYYQY